MKFVVMCLMIFLNAGDAHERFVFSGSPDYECFQDLHDPDWDPCPFPDLVRRMEEANAGNIGSIFELGLMYLEGAGTRRNVEKAVRLIESAAIQGYKDAQKKMEFFFMNGLEGVLEKDNKKAEYWRRMLDT